MKALGFYLMALCAGAMLPTQAMINGYLARYTASPVRAAAVSAVVSAVALVIMAVFSNAVARTDTLSAAPWWAWIGGLAGVIVLSAMATVAPRIGAASMMALIMTGQVITALTIDRMGWFGVQPQALSLHRLGAAALLIAGAGLMSLKG